MSDIIITFPNEYIEKKEWIKNTINVAIKSLSSTIGIYFKIEIKECNIILKKKEMETNGK